MLSSGAILLLHKILKFVHLTGEVTPHLTEKTAHRNTANISGSNNTETLSNIGDI